jgi:hypothetical protein
MGMARGVVGRGEAEAGVGLVLSFCWGNCLFLGQSSSTTSLSWEVGIFFEKVTK